MSSTYKSVAHTACTYDAVGPADADLPDWTNVKPQYRPLWVNRELNGHQEADVVFVGSHYVESSSEMWDSMVETAKEIGASQAAKRKRVFIVSIILLTLLFIVYHITGMGAGSRLYLLLVPALLLCLKYTFGLVLKFISWADLQIHSIRSVWATRRRYKRLVSGIKATPADLDEEFQDAVYEVKVRNFLNDRSEDV